MTEFNNSKDEQSYVRLSICVRFVSIYTSKNKDIKNKIA